MMKQRAFTLMELMIVIVIIGILATVGMVMFGGQSEKAKKTVAAKNYRQIINFIQTESALCEFYESNKIFGNNSCPITDSVPGAQSGWCGIFGDYFLKEAKFENPFGGSAFGVGNSQQDGITSCVLCNRSPYCSGSETNKKYKLMWWYDNKMQDFTIIAPN
jgi:type IV pilus assembly protein PilA